VTDRASGTERVVVLAETRETDPTARAALLARAHEITTDIAGTPPDEIVLAPPRTVPKTSSGKIRRSAAKELYEGGHIVPMQRALWWQLLRLALSAIGPQTRRLARLSHEMLYAAWWWVVLAAALLLGALALLTLPRVTWRWSALRWISRGTLAAMGVPVSTSGIDRVPSGARCWCSIIPIIWTLSSSLQFSRANRRSLPRENWLDTSLQARCCGVSEYHSSSAMTCPAAWRMLRR